MLATVKSALTAITGKILAATLVDGFGAQWVHDYMSQPAKGWKPITKDDAGNIAGKYRALRFDVAGVVKFDALDPDGTTTNTLIRNVAATEVWPAACVLRIYNTGTDSAVVVDGWS